MRIAIPVWNERVSPVFDVSRAVRIVDITEGSVTHETHHPLEREVRASTLFKLGVDLVICAAISTPLETTLKLSGIEVIPDTCGTVAEIVEAFASGDEELKRFRSPGNTRHHRSPHELSSHQLPGTQPLRKGGGVNQE
jgi:predicted Fe-Mo cluster-binding NifX family protein